MSRPDQAGKYLASQIAPICGVRADKSIIDKVIRACDRRVEPWSALISPLQSANHAVQAWHCMVCNLRYLI